MIIGINGYYLSTPYSGLGQYTYNTLGALAEIDKKNTYYVFSPVKIPWTFPKNFHLVVINPSPFFPKTFMNRFIWEEYTLGYAIKKYHIDVFHGLYQSLPKGAEKIGNVVTIHDATPWRSPFEKKEFLYRRYSNIRKRLIQKRAKKIVAISESSKLDFAPIYGMKPETIEVIYESISPLFSVPIKESEVKDFKNQYAIDRSYILYTGGLKRHKNLRMLIKSFAILVDEYGFTGDLYIIGTIRKSMAISSALYYSVNDLERYASMKKISEKVKFVGTVPERDMILFLHNASCFISLSLNEGFGLPALEAMASSCPTVLSDIPAFSEISGGASTLVYPYGPHRIAKALHMVLTDMKFKNELIKKGKERTKFFDRDKIATRLLEIYQEEYDDYQITFQP